MPYYLKYGFIPIDEEEQDILKINKQKFLNDPKLTKEKFINYFMYRDFDEEKDKKMLNYINSMLIPRLKENNLISNIIKSMIKDKNKESCKLLYHIYMRIYYDVKYIEYTNKGFELDLKKNDVIKTSK